MGNFWGPERACLWRKNWFQRLVRLRLLVVKLLTRGCLAVTMMAMTRRRPSPFPSRRRLLMPPMLRLSLKHLSLLEKLLGCQRLGMELLVKVLHPWPPVRTGLKMKETMEASTTTKMKTTMEATCPKRQFFSCRA